MTEGKGNIKMQNYPQIITRFFFVLMVVSLVAADARPSHLGENNQLIEDPEQNQYLEPALKQWQMVRLMQNLAEMKNQIPEVGEYGFDRALRSETERKRRYRACYFNPVSCFKK